MICNHCSAVNPDSAAFCQNCGQPLENPIPSPAAVQPQQAAQPAAPEVPFVSAEPVSAPQPAVQTPLTNPVYPYNPLSGLLAALFAHPLFLTYCILNSVVLLVNPLNVLQILQVIFCWQLYAQARKGQVTFPRMKNISGLVCAKKVIFWVGFGFLCFAAVLYLFFGMIGAELFSSSVLDGVMDTLEIDLPQEVMQVFGNLTISALLFLGGVIFFVAAGVLLLFNLLYLHPMHKLMKQICQGLQTAAFPSIRLVSRMKTTVLVFAILSSLSVPAELASFSLGSLGGIAGVAAQYILYTLLSKAEKEVRASNFGV